MITLYTINNKLLSSLCAGNLEYMGTEWGATEMDDVNIFSNKSVYPTTMSLDRYGYTEATFKFLIYQEELSAQEMELVVAELIGEMSRGDSTSAYIDGLCEFFFKEENGGYFFQGVCSSAEIKRINREQGIEISAKIKGIKMAKRTYTVADGKALTIRTSLPSAMRVDFSDSTNINGSFTFDGTVVDITGVGTGTFYLDGRTHKFVKWATRNTGEVLESNQAQHMSKLVFPHTKGGQPFTFTNNIGFAVRLTLYERLL